MLTNPVFWAVVAVLALLGILPTAAVIVGARADKRPLTRKQRIFVCSPLRGDIIGNRRRGPRPGASPVFPRVLGYLFDRILYGVKEYGRPLETNNGRSCLKDAIEEALDLPVYLTQLEMELETALQAIQTGNPTEAVAILRTILGKDRG